MKTISSIGDMRELSDALRSGGKKIGFVPTMGYLHEGHLALVRKARELGDFVVVSIFVNPLQFGPKEDFSRYPRDFERDAGLLEKEGTDIIFSPSGEEMYPEGFTTRVQVTGLEDHLCGETRKGHFVGVATVVAKLFDIVKPHFAVFGQKDFQQLVIIERMVRDLNMDIAIIPYPTVREEGGLAMSSRNIYLSPADREKALALFASILRLQELVKSGERNAGRLLAEAHKILFSREGVAIEYAGIYDPETLKEIDSIEKKAVYAVAVRIGNTRLIDNAILEV
jgi:pantoate--beta-alanine ligase